MSSLVVLGFDGIHTADEVLNKVRPMQKEHLIDLEDACVVERGKDGKVHIKQAVNLMAFGAATGGVQGMLLGTLVGQLADFGIDDEFVKKLGETIPMESSALFVLVRSVTEDKVLPEIEPYKPRVLKTSLSNKDEERLKAALSKAA